MTEKEQGNRAVRVDYAASVQEKHPIKAATILYSAPSFVLRGPIYLLFFSLFMGVVFSVFATTDERVYAPLTLQRESITLQALGGGVVNDVLVSENMRVNAGDVIAVVQERIRAALSPEQEALLTQIRTLEERLDKTTKDYEHRIAQLELEQRDLARRRGTDVSALDARISQIQLQLATAQRAKQSREAQLATARRNLATRQRLFDNRDITITEYERAVSEVRELERAVADSEGEIQKTRLTLISTQQERDRLLSMHDEERLGAEIENLQRNKEREIALLGQQIEDLDRRMKDASTLVRGVRFDEDRTYYTATSDGIITDLQVRREQLITPGAPIATIVREAAPLEARLYVENKDIGNLRYGQTVRIKYYAYPYQDYGIQTGVITGIATRPTLLPNGSSRYEVRCALDRETIRGSDGIVKMLELGLEGVAEIKTGSKRFIEIVFAPISRFFAAGEED